MKYRLFLALAIAVLVPFAIGFAGAPSAIAFGVRSLPPAPTPAPSVEISTATSLRSLAQQRGIGIGTAVQLEPFYNDARYRQVLAREFNILVPENTFKFKFLRPNRDEPYDFSQTDRLVEFAKAHQMQVRGSPLVWHYTQPDWLDRGKFTREELLKILQTHIQTVVGRYRGQVFAWDVVNEALNRDGSLRDTIWLRHIGPEYIDLAFRWAHEADPNARLFYSDYGNDEVGRKANAMYTMVAGLLQRDIPIDGVAMQAHKGLRHASRLDLLSQNIQRLEKLGLEVQFSELDVSTQDGTGSKEERFAQQARTYRDLLQVCLSYKNCTAFITWGFTDRHTWLGSLTGQLEAPLLFDEFYRPKPAYYALKDVLSPQSGK